MGNSPTKNELERIQIKESAYSQEARARSLAILKQLKSDQFLDICTIKNKPKLFDEDKDLLIICQEHLIGFNAQTGAKDPYKSFVEIFKKPDDLNIETFFDLEEFDRCKLNDVIRKRIRILLGLSYSFIKHNSYDVCYFILNGTFNEKYRENIYRNNLSEYSLDENKKMSLKINEEFYEVIEKKGAENRVFFRCLLEEYNACIEPDFKFDRESREKSLEILETIENGTKFKVLHKKFSTVFLHKDLDELPKILSESYYKFISISDIWIITIDKYVIKFNLRPNLKTFGIQFVLEIEKSSSDYKDYEFVEKEFEMNEEVRQQLKHVLGMSNHSFLLRNSEQVMSYISMGKWLSLQSLEGKIHKLLIEGNIFSNFTDYNLKKVYYDEIKEFGKGKAMTKFPSLIDPIVFGKVKVETVYSFINESLFKPTQMQYYFDKKINNTYNVLLLGPTGAGKSRLVNTFFNKEIVKSEAGFNSMTREIYFIRSQKPENVNIANNKEMILVDTIGLCDTSWENERVHSYIKSRINQNFQEVDIVLIVISRERLLKDVEENIRAMLDWLKYEKYYERFVFVFTKSSELTDEEKQSFRGELRKRLSLSEKTKDDAILFTDFPDTNDFTPKQQEVLINSFKALFKSITAERSGERIELNFEEKRANNVRNSKKSNCPVL